MVKNESVEEKKVEIKKENNLIGVSSSGSHYYYPIEYKYDEEAKCMVPYFGKPINRYEMIQASKPSCDINYILQRALAGDQSVLNVRQGSYADISDMPDNLNDLKLLQTNSINSFNNLDPNIKNLFNNDVDVFIKALSDGSYENIIKNYVDSQKVDDKKVIDKKESE